RRRGHAHDRPLHRRGDAASRGAPGMRCGVALLALLVGWAGWGTPARRQTAPASEIPALLRSGGYVIVVRHGATHPDQADTDPLNLDNVAKQRQLNDKGRA